MGKQMDDQHVNIKEGKVVVDREDLWTMIFTKFIHISPHTYFTPIWPILLLWS